MGGRGRHAARTVRRGCSGAYGCYGDDYVIPREPLSRATRVIIEDASAADAQPCRRRRRRHAVWRRSAGRFERRWGGLLFRSAVLAYWWRPAPMLRDKIEQGVRAIFAEDTPRCVAVHVRRGDACRTPWRKCPSLTIALRAARLFSDRYDLPTLFLATDDESVVRDVRARPGRKRSCGSGR